MLYEELYYISCDHTVSIYLLPVQMKWELARRAVMTEFDSHCLRHHLFCETFTTNAVNNDLLLLLPAIFPISLPLQTTVNQTYFSP